MTRLWLLLALLVAWPAVAQTTTYTYDANGNRLTETRAGETTRYTWDAKNRLIAVAQPDGRIIRYRYDPEDRRIEESDGVTTTRYRWDQGHLLSETNVAGNELRRYRVALTDSEQARGWAKLGTAAFAFFLGYTDAGTSPVHRHFLHDALATPIAIVNGDGAIAGRTTYDPWGNVTASQTPDPTLAAKPNRIGFTGYQLDRATSAAPDATGAISDARYYAKARYYGAAFGAFMSVDPWMGNAQLPVSLNKYTYANANPTVYFDPDGREGACVSIGRDCFGRDMTPREQSLRYNMAVVMAATPVMVLAGAEALAVTRFAMSMYRMVGIQGGATAAMVEGAALAETGTATAVSALTGAEIPQVTVAVAAASAATRALDDFVPPRMPHLPGGIDPILPPGALTSDVPTWADVVPPPVPTVYPSRPPAQAAALSEAQLDLASPQLSAIGSPRPGTQMPSARASTVTQNNQVGNAFDDYVAATKLRGLDERGQLSRQERLPTPELAPAKTYVAPDYATYTRSGDVAFYADAKTGALIPFDNQARGLVDWSTTTVSRTLIYYTPDGTARIDPNLINYAREHNVRIKQVGVR